MKTHPLLRKTALAATLASAGLIFGGSVLAAQAADADATRQAAPEASETAAPGGYVSAQDADQLLAKDLMGMDVKNEEDKDETVGKISDVILDRDGSISGIVVGVGGFLGMGEKDVGMPWDRIESVDTGNKVVHVDATKDELKDAPEFKDEDEQKKDDKRDSGDDDSEARVGYYVLDQGGDQILADKLVGMAVKNQGDDDEKVGNISDVILGMDGKVSGVVVGVGGFLGMGEKNVGMPWDRIQSVDSDDEVVRVDVSKDELKNAPEYKRSKDE